MEATSHSSPANHPSLLPPLCPTTGTLHTRISTFFIICLGRRCALAVPRPRPKPKRRPRRHHHCHRHRKCRHANFARATSPPNAFRSSRGKRGRPPQLERASSAPSLPLPLSPTPALPTRRRKPSNAAAQGRAPPTPSSRSAKQRHGSSEMSLRPSSVRSYDQDEDPLNG